MIQIFNNGIKMKRILLATVLILSTSSVLMGSESNHIKNYCEHKILKKGSYSYEAGNYESGVTDSIIFRVPDRYKTKLGKSGRHLITKAACEEVIKNRDSSKDFLEDYLDTVNKLVNTRPEQLSSLSKVESTQVYGQSGFLQGQCTIMIQSGGYVDRSFGYYMTGLTAGVKQTIPDEFLTEDGKKYKVRDLKYLSCKEEINGWLLKKEEDYIYAFLRATIISLDSREAKYSYKRR